MQQLGPERAFLMVNTPDEEGNFFLPPHKLQPDAQRLITHTGEEYGRVEALRGDGGGAAAERLEHALLIFDGLRRYRKEQGRLLLKMIRRYITQGRLIRVAGPDGMQYVPLVYDDRSVEPDVIVDEAPTAPNMKQRTWEAFTLLAWQMPQSVTPQATLIALDYSAFRRPWCRN